MRRLHAIAEFGRRALTVIELPLLLQQGAELSRSELDVDRCDLLTFLPEGGARLLAACDTTGSVFQETSLSLHHDSLPSRVLHTQSPLIIEDLAAEERLAPPGPFEHDIVSSLNVPLYGPGRLLGVLGAHSRVHRSFSTEDVEFLQAVAHMMSAALQHDARDDERRQRHMLRAEQMMALGQVAAGMAHELRNPLTSIKGLVQVNLREAATHNLPTEDLAVIEHEIRRMERTLQTFLDFARPPQPDHRPLGLPHVVERVFALVSGRARKQEVALRLEYATPVVIEADEDQLQQLLLNLVLNALDAMPGGGTIEVEIRSPRDGYVETIVRDSGPGIPAHILPKVFETFVSSKETGVGLGLPLSQRIAEDHGGTLSAYNLPPGGACFVLRLPSTNNQS